MSNKQYDQVVEFNRDILGIQERIISLQDNDEFRLSMSQLKEEITEIQEAYLKQDLTGVIDGLIDLEYFLLGVFYKVGLEEQDHSAMFKIVHMANMRKKMGQNQSRPGFDSADAIKPEDWQSPEEMLSNYIEVVHRVQQRKRV